MPESEHSERNLASILTRLGNVESMLRFTVASSADVKQHVEQALQQQRGAEVYLLLAEGALTQSDVQSRLGTSQATASRALSHLTRCGLVARDPAASGPGYVWRWTEVEEIVGVAKIAKKVVRDNSPKSN